MAINLKVRGFAALFAILATFAMAWGQDAPVTIRVDAGKSIGDYKPIWNYFGADEPNYTYAPDGTKLLG